MLAPPSPSPLNLQYSADDEPASPRLDRAMTAALLLARSGASGATRRGLRVTRATARRLLSTQAVDEAAALPHLTPARPSLATATFDWKDPLNLSASLTEEENAIYETARNFAQSELLPDIVAFNRAEKFDRGIMRAFGQLGLLGLTVPSEYGGGDAGYVAYGLSARAVEQVDSGYRSAMSVQSSLVMCAHPRRLLFFKRTGACSLPVRARDSQPDRPAPTRVRATLCEPVSQPDPLRRACVRLPRRT